MEDVEASWSSCLPRQGRRYLLFVQICEPPRPSPAYIKGAMNLGHALAAACSVVQLGWSSLLQKRVASPSELSPCGGSPDTGGGEGFGGQSAPCACLLPTAPLQTPSFLWFRSWPGIYLHFIRPQPHMCERAAGSPSPPPGPPWSQRDARSARRSSRGAGAKRGIPAQPQHRSPGRWAGAEAPSLTPAPRVLRSPAHRLSPLDCGQAGSPRVSASPPTSLLLVPP